MTQIAPYYSAEKTSTGHTGQSADDALTPPIARAFVRLKFARESGEDPGTIQECSS
ncbi:MAG: hypothetical protein ABI999_16240 [Acidobacteriota bacterium]